MSANLLLSSVTMVSEIVSLTLSNYISEKDKRQPGACTVHELLTLLDFNHELRHLLLFLLLFT